MCEVIRLDDYRAGQPGGAIEIFSVGVGIVGLDIIAPGSVASAMLTAALEHGGHCIHAVQIDETAAMELHVPPDAIEVVLAAARAAGVVIRDGR
jgi:hypothetical protein